MDNFNDYDDEVIISSNEEETVTEKSGAVDKFLNWLKNHKKEVAIGAGATTVGIILGKIFKKPEIKEVEVLPDPTIMDKYDRVPVEEHCYTDFKYVLKPEYRED